MDRLSLYLLRLLAVSFTFASGMVTFVILFTQSFRILSLVIDNSSTMAIFFALMGLTIPSILPLVLPLGMGVAVIFVYHKLTMDSELVVMRAAGISPSRLALPALILAGGVSVICLVLTLWITPTANRNLVALQYEVRDSMAVFLSRPGNFNDIADGLTFYARHRGSNGTLEGILIHDVRKPETPVTIMADTGQIINTNDQPQIVIFNGRRQELDPQSGRLNELAFDQYVLDINALRSASAPRMPDPREQSLSELLHPSITMLHGRASFEALLAEFNQRLATPFLPLAYTLVGLIALLVGEFNRRGTSLRIIIAGVAIIVIEATFMSLNSVIAKHVQMTAILYLVPIIPIIAGFALLGYSASGQPPRESKSAAVNHAGAS